MGILFAISVLALAALLWASLSIARHIRQERQRHASAGFAVPTVAGSGASTSDRVFPAHELNFSELSPYGPTVVSRTLIEHAPPPPIPRPVELPPLPLESLPTRISAPNWMSAADLAREASTQSTDPDQSTASLTGHEIPPEPTAEQFIEHAPEKITGAERQLTVEAPVLSMAEEDREAGPPLEPLPSLEALDEREADTEAEAQAAVQAQAEAELPPDLEAHAGVDPLAPALAPPDDISLTSHSEPRLSATASAEESPLPLPRTVPTFLPLTPRPPSAPVASPLKNRLDWTYFNKDMGDLSDPLPSHSRHGQRPH